MWKGGHTFFTLSEYGFDIDGEVGVYLLRGPCARSFAVSWITGGDSTDGALSCEPWRPIVRGDTG